MVSGLAASILTLVVLFILNALYSNWDSVTMGVSSIVGLLTYVTFWNAYLVTSGVIVIIYFFQTIRYGLFLRATREDEIAAQSIGFTAHLFAFVLSSAVAGVVVIMIVIDAFRRIEAGIEIGAATISLLAGAQEVALAVVMFSILIFRPCVLTGGREPNWPLSSTSALPSHKEKRDG